MYVIEASTAPRYELPGVEFTGMASPSRGSSQLCTWRITVAGGLDESGSHTLDRDEIFMVVSGAIRLAPAAPVLRTGDAAVVPAGTPITVSNPTAEPAEVIVAISAGFTATMTDGTTIGTPPWAS
jgi:mannose-6-phosphate isomerase-like protein (cupin superfamily)